MQLRVQFPSRQPSLDSAGKISDSLGEVKGRYQTVRNDAGLLQGVGQPVTGSRFRANDIQLILDSDCDAMLF